MKLSISLEETVHSYQVCNVPHTSSMMPMLISDPAFLKRKVLLARDADDDHGIVLVNGLGILA